MKGVPLRINVGPKDIEKSKLEISRRDTREKIIIGRNELVQTINRLAESDSKRPLYKGKGISFE